MAYVHQRLGVAHKAAYGTPGRRQPHLRPPRVAASRLYWITRLIPTMTGWLRCSARPTFWFSLAFGILLHQSLPSFTDPWLGGFVFVCVVVAGTVRGAIALGQAFEMVGGNRVAEQRARCTDPDRC